MQEGRGIPCRGSGICKGPEVEKGFAIFEELKNAGIYLEPRDVSQM